MELKQRLNFFYSECVSFVRLDVIVGTKNIVQICRLRIVRYPRVIVFLVFPILVYLCIMFEISYPPIPSKESLTAESYIPTYSSTSGLCDRALPSLELFSKQYNSNYKDRFKLFWEMKNVCKKTHDFSKLENGTVLLTDERYKKCCVLTITKPTSHRNRGFSVSSTCRWIENGKMDVSRLEFMAVRCVTPLRAGSVYNFHANIPVEEPRLKSKIHAWNSSNSTTLPYSVFVLVIDSTTKSEMHRSLKNTRDFLLSKMDFVEFRGHHPLGEPTQFNALPMLMGISRETFQRKYFHFKEKKFWDNSPFIWHAFNKLNYVTGYFEDDPVIGTFHYGGLIGFQKQPTTLYTRPLMKAHVSLTHRVVPRQYKPYCFGHRNVVEFLLDYHFETLTRLSEVPTFQVTWPCWPQHEYEASISFLDNDYMNFFKKLSLNQQILSNTLFIVTSDHGFFKAGNYRNIYEGLIERRNVPLFVRLPDRLKTERPEIQSNLIANSKLITSHYDIYQTFLTVARMSGYAENLTNLTTYGSSLLDRIPRNRTCKEARIPKNLCMCNVPFVTYANSSSLIQALKIDNKAFEIF